MIDRLWDEMQAGKSFWDVVREPYLKRELTRMDVSSIIKRALNQVGGKYVNILPLFNKQNSKRLATWNV